MADVHAIIVRGKSCTYYPTRAEAWEAFLSMPADDRLHAFVCGGNTHAALRGSYGHLVPEESWPEQWRG